MSRLPTPIFFFGLRPNEEVLIEIAEGKTLLITFLNTTEANAEGIRQAFFRYNGTTRSIPVQDRSIKPTVVKNRKASEPGEIGAALQGNLGSILVELGEQVSPGQPLFTIEAMKMETTVTAPSAGKVAAIYLQPKTLVEQGDAVLKIES
ncbi:MAG: hypothetical protein KatS3mg029_1009 [Saprospiraceae bacterium]|nr:MAG: hypothetical protein KatS3mg029_1009 [Saprospiraceae bacterium]